MRMGMGWRLMCSCVCASRYDLYYAYCQNSNRILVSNCHMVDIAIRLGRTHMSHTTCSFALSPHARATPWPGGILSFTGFPRKRYLDDWGIKVYSQGAHFPLVSSSALSQAVCQGQFCSLPANAQALTRQDNETSNEHHRSTAPNDPIDRLHGPRRRTRCSPDTLADCQSSIPASFK